MNTSAPVALAATALVAVTTASCLVDRMVSDRSLRVPDRWGGGGSYFAAPNGSSHNDGGFLTPWDLATALEGGKGKVLPGDTIWLRGGIYRRPGGEFRSGIGGTADNPVVVRAYPGERAIVDGVGTPSGGSSLDVHRPWVEFWGLEFTNSDPVRTTTSTAYDVRANGVSNYASHTRFINLVIHDAGVAFYTDPSSADVEIGGCIIYNNGWQGPTGDRGHGHGLYLQSNTGPIVARDNVVFNQFDYGAHIYADLGAAGLRNIRLEGNVFFNNSSLSDNSTSGNVLVGGEELATDDTLIANLTYFSPSVQGTSVQIGYGSRRNGSVALRDNYFAGGASVLDVGVWDSLTVTGNTFIGSGRLINLHDSLTAGYQWRRNLFFRDSSAAAWTYQGATYGFADWLVAARLTDVGQVEAPPADARVIVRANPYEAGRAHVVVYNWGQNAFAVADLTGVLAAGDRYELRNVQALFGPPVLSGTYNGSGLVIPMTGVPPPPAEGFSTSRAPRTGPDFDVFLVTRLSPAK